MTLSISSIFCIGLGIPIILAVVLQFFQRFRPPRTVADSLRGMQRIEEAVLQLSRLEPKERAACRRTIAREILLDVGFVHSMMSDCFRDDPPQDPEVRERTLAAAREIVRLIWDLNKSLLLFRFRPKLARDCRRIVTAVEGHYRVWLGYIHFLKARYPELYGDLMIPDLQ